MKGLPISMVFFIIVLVVKTSISCHCSSAMHERPVQPVGMPFPASSNPSSDANKIIGL